MARAAGSGQDGNATRSRTNRTPQRSPLLQTSFTLIDMLMRGMTSWKFLGSVFAPYHEFGAGHRDVADEAAHRGQILAEGDAATDISTHAIC